MHDHVNFFFNEQLIDKNINGKITVRCYDLMISPYREDELRERFEITAWNGSHEEYSKSVSRRRPFRVIVSVDSCSIFEWEKILLD